MNKELPDFECLRLLAETDPEKLETVRKEHIDDLINQAPKKYQRGLNGMQFQINMALRRSPNTVNSCVVISRMMLDSFAKLQEALNAPLNKENLKTKQIKVDGKIIPFPKPYNDTRIETYAETCTEI